MIQSPLISAIVPVYNAEQYLARCIESIIAQSFTDFELILVNDGSTDSSAEICDQYSHNDLRITAIHKINGGVSSARNKGIDIAKGKFVCFIDSDDWIEADYFESFFVLKHTELKYSLVVQDFIKEKEGITSVNCNFQNEKIASENFSLLFSKLHMFRFGYPFAKLYSAEIIKTFHIRFDTTIHFSEDLIFMLEYLLYVNNVYVTNTAKYHYITHREDSLSKSYNSYESEIACFQKTKKLYTDLTNRFNLDSGAQDYIQISIGHFLLRSVQSLYRPNHKKKYTVRRNILRSVMTLDNSKYFSNYTKYGNSRFYFIPNILFKNQKVRLFDLYLNVTFFIRYRFDKLWKHIKMKV